jgi:predicted SprT family Zn-dependent metalloprotease
VTSLAWARQHGAALLERHLPTWSFGFDHARTRAGCCHYAQRRITLSRCLLPYLGPDAVEQTLLHEIAHAQAGAAAGHGLAWRRAADRLGYTGRRTIDIPEARQQARWRAVCPNGHEHLRHRRPPAGARCGPCARAGFDWVLTWADRSLESRPEKRPLP